MKTQIDVSLGDRSYPVFIGGELLSELPALLEQQGIAGRVMVITNRVVAKLYGHKLTGAFAGSNIEPNMIVIPDGESYKSLVTAGRLYESLCRRNAERNTPVIAFGGGVIGDLAGFVAATYQRGVPFVQVPTTLLSQVDSSIGGKVAVNVEKLKNMAGAFYQPRLVVSDTTLAATLPSEEIKNGLSEIIKCAVIDDAELFSFLEDNISAIIARDIEAVTHVVSRAAEIKVRIVEQDERDLGMRQMLNFGHTLGHAVEAASDFGINHGTAVALGMAAASRLANRQGILAVEVRDRIIRLIGLAGLPVTIPVKRPEAVISAMKHDKKITDGKLRFILPTVLGNVIIRDDIDPNQAVEALSG